MNEHNETTRGGAFRLPHHFESRRQHFESNILGIWLFLVTEIMMFGGLFCAYAVYRARHPEVFIYAHRYLDSTLGGVNTVVLICSSLTMAWAVRCAQLDRRRGLILCLSLTLMFAGCFMGVKAIEYNQKWKHGLLWGAKYHPAEHAAEAESGESVAAEHGDVMQSAPPLSGARQTRSVRRRPTAEVSNIGPAADGPGGLAEAPGGKSPHGEEAGSPRNVHIFFGIYFIMTGLHGLHVLAGMGLIAWLIALAAKGRFAGGNFVTIDQVGLYWHLVDMIWIFLFPLLYLIH